MRFLLDTNVISEGRRKKAEPKVLAWITSQRQEDMLTSVLVLGELRAGVEALRSRDPAQYSVLEQWLDMICISMEGRILPVTEAIAHRWGRLCPGQALPGTNGLIAATALEHGLTVVTRNVDDFVRSGVPVLNPWM